MDLIFPADLQEDMMIVRSTTTLRGNTIPTAETGEIGSTYNASPTIGRAISDVDDGVESTGHYSSTLELDPETASDLSKFGNFSAGNGNGSQALYTEVIIVLMYVLIIVVAVGGNLLCAYIIVLKQKIWSVTNLFLLNLTISDVVKALICNPFSFMANLILQYWPYGDFMCPAVTYVQVCPLTLHIRNTTFLFFYSFCLVSCSLF